MNRRCLLCICLTCLPFLCGCFLLPCFVYPTLHRTAEVKLDAPDDDVHAFRVDITNETNGRYNYHARLYEELAEIPVVNSMEIPAQVKRGVTVCLFYAPFLTCLYSSQSLAMRLYRPGYELVEIQPWQSVCRVDWTSACDLEAQEKVLDKLFPVEWTEHPGGKLGGGQESSQAHRVALLFGTSEYERLAANVESDEQRTRLLRKADALRSRIKERR